MRHSLLSLALVALWGAVVWWGSQWLAPRYPQSGPALGFAGTLCLFWPIASVFVWDIIASRSGKPQSHGLYRGEGYDPFSWFKLGISFVGITLIGLGFGVASAAG